METLLEADMVIFSEIRNLNEEKFELPYSGVFRTLSNIYDGAFL